MLNLTLRDNESIHMEDKDTDEIICILRLSEKNQARQARLAFHLQDKISVTRVKDD